MCVAYASSAQLLLSHAASHYVPCLTVKANQFPHGSNMSSKHVADILCRCVTFENPGVAKYWRKKAEQAHDQQHWEDKVLNYVTYPNPINTCLPHIGKVVRLQLGVHKS